MDEESLKSQFDAIMDSLRDEPQLRSLLEEVRSIASAPDSEERKRRSKAFRDRLRAERPPDWKPEFPFEHPAADDIDEILDAIPDNYPNVSRRDGYVWLVRVFETEVMNGGIDQFLFNDSGQYAMQTLDALQAIGAQQSYRLLKQACDLFPAGRPSPNEKERWEQIRAITGGNKHIDDMIDGSLEVDLYQLLLDYWRDADPSAA